MSELDEASSCLCWWPWRIFIPLLFLLFHYVYFLRRKQNVLFREKTSPIGWKFGLKKLLVYFEIHIYQKWIRRDAVEKRSIFVPSDEDIKREMRRHLELGTSSDQLRVQCLDQHGNIIAFAMGFYPGRSELILYVSLANGDVYRLPSAPNSFSDICHESQEESWNVGGLTFQVLEAGRKYRFIFNGLLQKINSQGDNTIHHVQLNFIWSAGGNIIDVKRDWHPSLMADALARETWKLNEWRHLVKDQGRGFDQWGVARGLVRIDGCDAIDLNLPSLRQRRWGAIESDTLLNRIVVMGVTEEGLCFYLRASSHPFGLTYARFGHIRFPDGTQTPVSDFELSMEDLPRQDGPLPKNILYSLTAKGHKLDGYISPHSEQLLKGYRFAARFAPLRLSLNGRRGVGITGIWYRDESSPVNLQPRTSLRSIPPSIEEDSSKLTVQLSDASASNVLLTGGKASSLAVLTAVETSKFKVPAGFCLTVNALDEHLKRNKLLMSIIEELKETSFDRLRHKCSEIEEIFSTTSLSHDLMIEIEVNLRSLKMPVAVRSSGTTEDGDENSSAGQNATFLGLSTIESVIEAVKKCWASLYSFTSLQYRLEHMLPVVTQMSVVIQEMAFADVAGVLFTVHPVSNDPRRMLITANLGLGETVVSGSVVPDSIEILKTSTSTQFLSATVGHKDFKIVIAENGTKEELLSDQEAFNLCLTQDEIARLGEIGREIEKLYNSPRDIEWAISNGVIYLLQARPITSSGWTDHELLHEMDDPIFSDTDISTTANTGEVLPGATSALSLSYFHPLMGRGEKTLIRVTHHHAVLDVLRTTLQAVQPTVDIGNHVTDLAVMGHLATTPELLGIAIRRNGIASRSKQMRLLAGSIKAILKASSKASSAEKLRQGHRIDMAKLATIEDVFDAILKHSERLVQIQDCHYITSQASTTAQVLLFTVLAGGKDLTTENISDIATILASSSKSVSSGIPIALSTLAEIISAHHISEKFIDAEIHDAIPLLVENHPSAAKMWTKFIDQFGHRSWREFDLATEVWALNPLPIVQSLQCSVKRKLYEEDRTEENLIDNQDEDIVGKLKTTLSPAQKWILRKLISLCRTTVNHRETTKDAWILTIHGLRLAFRELADRMVKINMLPRPSLIFHFTIPELLELITKRNGQLIVKASKRQRLLKRWDLLEFPEIMIGLPQPIQKTTLQSVNAEGRVRGTPVYPGQVLGRALVAATIDDLINLEPGDILVTHSTDVGWSPYFPLLGGVVTELGGLISHGAVVAREYGLPCVVAAAGATNVFRTGDMIVMNASDGFIEKVASE